MFVNLFKNTIFLFFKFSSSGAQTQMLKLGSRPLNYPALGPGI